MLKANKRSEKRGAVTRDGKMVGGYVPTPMAQAIEDWVSADHERTASSFIRAAAREKLLRDGIEIKETQGATR